MKQLETAVETAKAGIAAELQSVQETAAKIVRTLGLALESARQGDTESARSYAKLAADLEYGAFGDCDHTGPIEGLLGGPPDEEEG